MPVPQPPPAQGGLVGLIVGLAAAATTAVAAFGQQIADWLHSTIPFLF